MFSKKNTIVEAARQSVVNLSIKFGYKPSKVQFTTYFRDGKRKIDAILVYQKSKPNEERDIFIKNLKKNSFELEEETSVEDPDRIYIKVHASEQLLEHNAKLLGIPVKHDQLTILAEDRVHLKFMKNILNDPDPDQEDPIAQRAWKTISKEKPTQLTTCERSAIVFIMMDNISFGTKGEEFKIGLQHLEIKGGFVAAYPIHDGPWEWPEDPADPLNDRQLLAQYWANYHQIIKQQPLTTVENYFGPEIAMYFGWLGFYNKMLLYASVMGVVTYLYSICSLLFVGSKNIDEVCTSNLHICPLCKRCPSKLLKTHCFTYKFAYVHDHASIVIFACAMSFWAQAFMEFWKRRESNLVLKWNLNTAIDDQIRPEFQATAKGVRKHQYTGEMEQYVPLKTRLLKYSVSITIVVFMILTVLATIFIVIIGECLLKVRGIERMQVSAISSFVTLVVMMILRRVYGSIAKQLTIAENPRTLDEFDKSFMIKMVVFSLINNFGKLIYIAFFKGKFFTYPGDETVRLSYFPLAAEICGPAGCVYDVSILLGIIIVIKPVFNNCWEIMVPMIEIWKNKLKKKSTVRNDQKHIWEHDYDLISDYQCTSEFEEMVMQYGFVTLLVAAFPLAPLFALLNNIFEVRIDANKLLKFHRRPSSIYKQSIRIWFDTLQSITFMAIITNALYLSFTTNFIARVIYFIYYKQNYEGFYLFLLSKYKVVDNYWSHANITECYYAGHRYPPEDPNKYTLTYLHYYILSCQLSFAIIFVVSVLFITAIIAYAIPDIPAGIRDLIAYNARKERKKLHGA